VALVAVSIGVRLVDGSLGLTVGLFALLLAPEAYLPLRQVGAQFHAAADGVAAAESVFEILDAAADLPAGALVASASASASATATAGAGAGATTTATAGAPTLEARRGLHCDSVSAGYGDRTVVDSLTATCRPGELTVIAGPSGTGKSTLVAALLGFIPATGTIRYGDEVVSGASLRALISWAGQKPSLVAGTVAENVALGASEIDAEILREALSVAAATALNPGQVLGVNGSGLSVGQAHRVAIARALYRALVNKSPVILLDEPSAALDEATEKALIGGLIRLSALGFIVIVVSHRDAFLAAADNIIDLAVVAATGMQESLS
jgi:ATP-binding cassette subfamily C protein CydD